MSTSNIEQKEQTNRDKYIFYCSVSQIHINPAKTRKTHQNDFSEVLIIVKLKALFVLNGIFITFSVGVPITRFLAITKNCASYHL